MIKRVNRPSTRTRWRKETVSNSFCVDFYSKRVDLFSIACCFQKVSNSKQTKDSLTKVQYNI